ncbi:CD276 antigen homolog isoform X2 [Carassius auratus]|uniref:CD276 antigen homolog isoform X2 n=1 Tax=Carassius auratus TaxID=7957 RepID=A0A6P6J1N3_CARAU|nr:CD276 antigen homolog isoform X2 [Carassius auratus]
MIIGFCFIIVFAVLINKVSLQLTVEVTVEGFIGGSVLLPCSSTQHDLKLQDTDVFWRNKASQSIYDLIKGTESLESQDPRYKNRVQTFPDEYKRGNFSIKLIDLTHADEGTFICLITRSNERGTVQLIIKESTDQENHGPETQILDWWKILLICVFTLLPVFGLSYFIFQHGKRTLPRSLPYRKNSSTLSHFLTLLHL